MADYLIADIFVQMHAKYDFTQNLAKPYLYTESYRQTSALNSTPMRLQLRDAFLQQKITENPHLPPEMVEHIYLAYKFALSALEYDCVNWHASAIMYKNKAYLFSAPANGGKSTHTKLWRQVFGTQAVQIINDDKPAIRLVQNTLYVYGTPFSGGTALNTNIKAPLGAVVFLKKSNRNTVRKVGGKEILPLFLDGFPRNLSAKRTEKVLDLAQQIVETIPCYSMECTQSEEAAVIAEKNIIV